MSSMQQVVHSINFRVEQCLLDIQECLQHHDPVRDDDDHPTLVEEDWFILFEAVLDFFFLEILHLLLYYL
jgi:hypothetical protein